MVLIIHSAVRFIYYVIVQQVENWTQLLLSVSLEYTVLQKKNGFNICVQCQHTWHLAVADPGFSKRGAMVVGKWYTKKSRSYNTSNIKALFC